MSSEFYMVSWLSKAVWVSVDKGTGIMLTIQVIFSLIHSSLFSYFLLFKTRPRIPFQLL